MGLRAAGLAQANGLAFALEGEGAQRKTHGTGNPGKTSKLGG